MRLLTAIILSVIILASGCATTSSVPAEPVPPLARNTSLPPAPEGGYTWRNLLDLVLETNQDHNALLAKARAEYFRYKSRTDPNEPQFSVEYSYLSDDRRNGDYDFGFRLPIPNPFLNRHIVRTGEAAQREAETESEAFRHELASIIYEFVQGALIGERELSILRLREQVLSERTTYMETRYNVRMATQADMRELDIQRLRLKADIQRAQYAAQAARRGLQILVQIPDEQLVLKPTSTDWEAQLAALENDQALIDEACSRSAELSGAIAAYEKACATLDTARARQIPWFNSIYVTYSPSSTNDTYVSSTTGQIVTSTRRLHHWTLGVSVNLPVFAWFSAEKKQANAEIETASLQIAGIRQRVRKEVTWMIGDLRDTLKFLIEFQSIYDSIPEPTREAIPDLESYYKILDTRLSASEHVIKMEEQYASIYRNLLKLTGGWD